MLFSPILEEYKCKMRDKISCSEVTVEEMLKNLDV